MTQQTSVTEFDLFTGYAGDDNRPTIVRGSGSGYGAGCGSIVANTYRWCQLHVEFHNSTREKQ